MQLGLYAALLVAAGGAGAQGLASAGGRLRAKELDHDLRLSWAVDSAIHEALPATRWNSSRDRLRFRAAKPHHPLKEWARRMIAKVQQKHQTQAVKDAEPEATAAEGWHGPLWFFAAHHKAGTNLLNSLAKLQGHSLGLSLCTGSCGINRYFGPSQCRFSPEKVSERMMFYCNAGSSDLEAARRIGKSNLRAVHIIRDPIALVISGYVYDMHNEDGMHADLAMRSSDVVSGVAMEAEFALKATLPNMLAVHKSGQEKGDVLVVRMEDFLSSSQSFDDTVDRLFTYTMGQFVDRSMLDNLKQQATSEDLNRNPEPKHPNGVSRGDLKGVAKNALQSLPELLQRLQEYRVGLGYADA